MITFDKANEIYFEQFFGGRKKDHPDKKRYVFPFGKVYEADGFVEVSFPLQCIKPRLRQPELVQRYANNFSEQVPAVWLSLGRLLRDGSMVFHWDRGIKVMDGFHRIAAAKSLGYDTIKAIMPKSHWDFYQKLEVRDNGLYYKN